MHHLSTLDHTGAICQTNLIDLSSPSAMYEDKELTKVDLYLTLSVIIPYYIEFNGPVMASMKIKTVQTILLSAV